MNFWLWPIKALELYVFYYLEEKCHKITRIQMGFHPLLKYDTFKVRLILLWKYHLLEFNLSPSLNFLFLKYLIADFHISQGTSLKTSTTNSNARALGDASLYQSYFVCITESEKSTLIEYGKSLGTSDSGDIYLNLIDSNGHLNVRFYAFGNDENPAKVMDSHIVSRPLTKAECKGDTVKDLETNLCVQKCHKYCDPLAGRAYNKK